MPILGALFLAIFTPIFSFLAAMVARKVAVIAAYLAASAIIVGSTVLVVRIGVEALVVSMPSGFAMGAWLFVPDNAGSCVAAALAADLAASAMRWWHANAGVVARISGS